jgi:hypothetical protein
MPSPSPNAPQSSIIMNNKTKTRKKIPIEFHLCHHKALVLQNFLRNPPREKERDSARASKSEQERENRTQNKIVLCSADCCFRQLRFFPGFQTGYVDMNVTGETPELWKAQIFHHAKIQSSRKSS